MKLVDTNVLSELVRPKPNRLVVSWFETLDGCAISVITVEEIAFGIARLPKRRHADLVTWLDRLLDASTVLDVTTTIARTGAEQRAIRTSTGRPAHQADMLIAATAIVHGLVLATRNVDDFRGCGVAIENPFDA